MAIDDAVAVVVEGVAAVLDSAWVDGYVVVVAVAPTAARRQVAVAVFIHAARRALGRILVVDEPVAVVVDAIGAILAHPRVDEESCVVAVGAAAARIRVPVAVGVPTGRRTLRVGAVDEPIAVVVDAVLAVLAAAGVDGGARVVAVRAATSRARIAVVVSIDATDRAEWVGAVHEPVAVVVDAVAADLAGSRVNGGVGVVAVGASTAARFVAVAVGVVAAGQALRVGAVDTAVAVVVDAIVADLGEPGVNVSPCVIAVRAAAGCAPVAVSVEIGATCRTQGIVVIGEPVAVVVDAVHAILASRWINE